MFRMSAVVYILGAKAKQHHNVSVSLNPVTPAQSAAVGSEQRQGFLEYLRQAACSLRGLLITMS
jgi:hypothetical protein